jgi:hypothetical protein
VILVSLALLGGLELMAFREETDNLAMMSVYTFYYKGYNYCASHHDVMVFCRVLQDLVDRQALQE